MDECHRPRDPYVKSSRGRHSLGQLLSGGQLHGTIWRIQAQRSRAGEWSGRTGCLSANQECLDRHRRPRHQPFRNSMNPGGTSMQRFENLIAGEWNSHDLTGRTINPSDTREIVGEYAIATTEDVSHALAAARAAFSGWSRTNAQLRSEVLYRAGS